MTDEEVEKSKVVPNEVTGCKSEDSELITTESQPDFVDQHLNFFLEIDFLKGVVNRL